MTTDLLTRVLDAHGGIDRWRQFSRIEATIVSGGLLFELKGMPQDSTPRRMTVALQHEWSSIRPFGADDQRTDFTPDRVAIEKLDGSVVAERTHPRDSFTGHTLDTPWDPLQRAYFNGYALWTYLTTPFLLAVNGVQTAEIEPWREGVETWRVLRALFPSTIASHSAVQDFFFGEDLLLRRHDYNVDIAGGFAAAQLVFAYVEADGVKLPTQRRAYIRGPDHRPALDPLMVSIDISEVRFE